MLVARVVGEQIVPGRRDGPLPNQFRLQPGETFGVRRIAAPRPFLFIGKIVTVSIHLRGWVGGRSGHGIGQRVHGAQSSRATQRQEDDSPEQRGRSAGSTPRTMAATIGFHESLLCHMGGTDHHTLKTTWRMPPGVPRCQRGFAAQFDAMTSRAVCQSGADFHSFISSRRPVSNGAMDGKPRLALCMEYPVGQTGGVEVLVGELVRGLAGTFDLVLVSQDESADLKATGLETLIAGHVPGFLRKRWPAMV